MSRMSESASKEGFPRAFWVANVVELLERAAWYGVFVAITLYLSRILAFTDIEAATVSGVFSRPSSWLRCGNRPNCLMMS